MRNFLSFFCVCFSVLCILNAWETQLTNGLTQDSQMQSELRNTSAKDLPDGIPMQNEFLNTSAKDLFDGNPMQSEFPNTPEKYSLDGIPMQSEFLNTPTKDLSNSIPMQGEFLDTSLSSSADVKSDLSAKPLQLYLDIGVILDTTASFGPQLQNNIKKNFLQFFQKLLSRYPLMRLAVVGFRDKNVAPFGLSLDYCYKIFSHFSNDVASVSSEVQKIRASGGYDTPENPLEAMLVSTMPGIGLGWRKERRINDIKLLNLMLVITDADYKAANFWARTYRLIYMSRAPQGKNTGHLEDCNTKEYPSEEDVAEALREFNIYPMFCVPAPIQYRYNKLKLKFDKGGVCRIDMSGDLLKVLDKIISSEVERHTEGEHIPEYTGPIGVPPGTPGGSDRNKSDGRPDVVSSTTTTTRLTTTTTTTRLTTTTTTTRLTTTTTPIKVSSTTTTSTVSKLPNTNISTVQPTSPISKDSNLTSSSHGSSNFPVLAALAAPVTLFAGIIAYIIYRKSHSGEDDVMPDVDFGDEYAKLLSDEVDVTIRPVEEDFM